MKNRQRHMHGGLNIEAQCMNMMGMATIIFPWNCLVLPVV